MFFQLTRLLYRAYVPCILRFSPAFPCEISGKAEYTVKIQPFSGWRLRELFAKGRTVSLDATERFEEPIPLEKTDNCLSLSLVFPQEDRYIITLYADGKAADMLAVYALEEDLYALTPYKGDNHLHSFYSDGTESPEYMAAYCRRLGYDYVVLTDHYQYEPSLRAADVLSPFRSDFLVIPGEEIHSPNNPVHIINLGGCKSVNAWYREDPEAYESSVQRHMKTIQEPMTPHARYATAASMAMFEKIREADGVAILCHPGWIKDHTLQQEQDITDCLFDRRCFDALELIAGGAGETGTQLQVSYYQGKEHMPVLGSSDAHRTSEGHLTLGNYTIVFAAELSMKAIKSAIRNGYCVAACVNKLYGPYRLVLYAYFLLEHVFPQHDRICSLQGKEMIGFACGKAEVKPGCREQIKESSRILADFYAAIKE